MPNCLLPRWWRKVRPFLKKLLAMTKEELAADLYFVDILSTKRRSLLKNMQENL